MAFVYFDGIKLRWLSRPTHVITYLYTTTTIAFELIALLSQSELPEISYHMSIPGALTP